MPILLRKLRKSIYKRIVARPNFFINPSDLMSDDVMLDGKWDSFLTSSIMRVANNFGKKTVFLDIGANIGLISCQVHEAFKHVIAIEPSPVALNILKANFLIHIPAPKYEIYSFALSNSNGTANLLIPKGNLGGSLIIPEIGGLSKDELAKKEGGVFQVTAKHEVCVVNSLDFFNKIAVHLGDTEHLVVKIDIEGSEMAVLPALMSSELWIKKKVVVFFETWSNQFVSQLVENDARLLLVKKQLKTSIYKWTSYQLNEQMGNTCDYVLSNFSDFPSFAKRVFD